MDRMTGVARDQCDLVATFTKPVRSSSPSFSRSRHRFRSIDRPIHVSTNRRKRLVSGPLPFPLPLPLPMRIRRSIWPFHPSALSLPPSGLIGHAKCPQPVSLPASLFSASVAVADAAAARFAEYPLRHEYPRLSCTSLTITIHKKEGSVPGHVLYCNPVTPCRHVAILPTSEFR